MSVVTNVILTYGCSETFGDEEGQPRLDEINAVLRSKLGDHSQEAVPFKPVDEFAGGYKHMESGVALAALNHTPINEIVAAIREAKWNDLEEVQLFVKEQWDERFHEVAWR